MIASQLRVVWAAFCLHLKQMAVDSWVLFTVIVQPLIVALLAIYMLKGTPGFQGIYAIVGSALTGLWSGTIYISCRGLETERWSGTLEAIIGSPTHVALIITAKALATVTLSLGSMLVSYPLAAFLFGYGLTVAQPLAFTVSLLLAVVALVSLGLLIAPIVTMNPGSWIWANAVEFPVYMLGGFLFPVLILPAWTRPISYALAPYWAARALHAASSSEASPGELLLCWGLLVASSAVYWCMAALLFRTFLRRAREQATLGVQ